MLQEFYIRAGKLKKLFIRGLILYGGFLITAYLLFRAYYINFDPRLVVFSILLFLAELHTIVLMYGFLYSLWPRKYIKYKKLNKKKDLEINMFVTVAGEPFEVVKKTITHAKVAADHYFNMAEPNKRPRVIVLNDGKAAGKTGWEKVQDYCENIGVEHVARESNEGFKAGNINNGLKVFPSKDPHNTIDCFFDSDFCAKPNFLFEILKPLADEKVDFVQSPQRYTNLNTWVAKGAGAHQIFFFDYICPAKAYDNALFLCGTNYAIRRRALLDAGGVDNRFVTEDYATSIRLHLQGKKGVFIPDVLAEGLAPMNLKEYFNQQTRWCKGCLDANGKYLKELFFGPLNARQKFHYFLSTAYYFIGIRDLILVLAPIPYLFFGVSLIRANTNLYLAMIYLPLVIYNFALFGITFRNPIKSLVLDIVSFPVFAKAFISSVVRYNLPFSITVKKYEKENPFKVYKVQLTLALILLAGLIYSTFFRATENFGAYINYFWAIFDATFLFIGFWLVVKENYSFRFKLDFDFQLPRPARIALRTATVTVMSLMIGLFSPVAYDFVNQKIENVYLTSEVQDALAQVNLDRREELLVPENGIYYGYYMPELNSHPENPNVKLIESENPSLTMFYQDWSPESKFNTKFMNDLSDEGVTPIVTWEPFVFGDHEHELNQDGAPQKLIVSGKYDEFISSWARSAKAYGKPMFLRFAHEMNGNWYPWGNTENSDANDYRDMWIHVHNIFEEEGANNVVWVWSPNNTDEYGVTEGVLDYYPGSRYVDWVAYSAFNWGNSNYDKPLWRTFKYMSWDIYNELSTLDKPIMVAETSSASKGGDKTRWFYQTLGLDIPELPNIKAVVMFNQNVGTADFDLNSDMNPQIVFDDLIVESSYFIKEPIVVVR